MSNQVYFRLNHDADRFTDGVTYSIHDPGGPAVGEVLSLDEPDAVGDFVITKIGHKQAIGGGNFPYLELKV